MLKISLMDQSDLELAYEIEKEVNPTPWSKNGRCECPASRSKKWSR